MGIFSLLAAVVIAELSLEASTQVGNTDKLPDTFDQDGPYYPEISLEFEAQFPKLPKKMMVYKVKDPNVTEAHVCQLAQKHFGLTRKAKLSRSKAMNHYRLKEDDWQFEVSPISGAFKIRKIIPNDLQSDVKKKYPSKEQCRPIAENYLKKRSLLERDTYIRRVVDNTKGAGVMSVGLGRLIGGYKSWGAGSEIILDIGPAGETIKVRKAWQTLAPYKMYPIKSCRKALEELQAGKGILMNGSKGKVNQITLRYYTSPARQEYVQPIYYFYCNGPEGSFYGVVPAIKAEHQISGERKPSKRSYQFQPKFWFKCQNTVCEAEYQIYMDEYLKFIGKHLSDIQGEVTEYPIICRKCGQLSAYMGYKCPKCNLFFQENVTEGNRFRDRCPKCGYSKDEADFIARQRHKQQPSKQK
jgi:hypothetical protein